MTYNPAGIDIEGLVRAAEAATGGEWRVYNRAGSGAPDEDFLGWDFEEGAGPPEPGRGRFMGPDARYAVAAQPSVVLALVAQRAALVEALQNIATMADEAVNNNGGIVTIRRCEDIADDARAALKLAGVEP